MLKQLRSKKNGKNNQNKKKKPINWNCF
jgi:hypothetical protein